MASTRTACRIVLREMNMHLVKVFYRYRGKGFSIDSFGTVILSRGLGLGEGEGYDLVGSTGPGQKIVRRQNQQRN